MKVVLVDDEKSIRITLGDDISEAGYTLSLFEDGSEAFESIKKSGCDVLISDLKMPGMDGVTLLQSVKKLFPLIKVILITGYGTIENAVAAMKYGAYDYVVKPFMNEKIINMLKNIEDMHRVYDENLELKKQVSRLSDDNLGFHGMVGTSTIVQDMFKKIQHAAQTDANVLIEGESGTGKELVAKAIHAVSSRKDEEMIVLSCAACPESLLEDELFGHEIGAFTGANSRKKGKFERAHRSTLFIDDIDDMSLNTQVKLVRILQERTFERLGGTELVSSDFRILTASKASLKKLVDEGTFREDLFFRLNILRIQLPPLREREGDIELLAHYFKSKYASSNDCYFSEETLRLISTYSWPGNVRELENAIIRAAAMCDDREQELKKENIFQFEETGSILVLNEATKRFEREHIIKVLKKVGYHRSQAAEMLGISRKTLWEKMKSYDISG